MHALLATATATVYRQLLRSSKDDIRVNIGRRDVSAAAPRSLPSGKFSRELTMRLRSFLAQTCRNVEKSKFSRRSTP
jgi:hypothetical protein